MNNKTMRYPRPVAIAEIASKKQHKEIGELNEDFKFQPLTPEQLGKLSKTYFDLSGTYPYIFDVLSYVCTHHKEMVELVDDPRSLHFRVTLPVDKLFDFALDGYNEQAHHLLKGIIDLANSPPRGKTFPISPTQSVTTVPIILSIAHEKTEDLSESKIKQLKNIGAPTMIKSISILFFKSLFYELFEGNNGENWFPLPKAFQAKLLHTLKENANNPEIKKLGVKGYASTYRRYFLYLNARDNSESQKLTLNGIDLWESISPGEVQKLKDGTKSLRRWEKARTWLHKANVIFNIMAQKGLLTGAKFAPTAVWYERPLREYTVHLQRKYFDNIKPLEDRSPIKALEHFQEENDSQDAY